MSAQAQKFVIFEKQVFLGSIVRVSKDRTSFDQNTFLWSVGKFGTSQVMLMQCNIKGVIINFVSSVFLLKLSKI